MLIRQIILIMIFTSGKLRGEGKGGSDGLGPGMRGVGRGLECTGGLKMVRERSLEWAERGLRSQMGPVAQESAPLQASVSSSVQWE